MTPAAASLKATVLNYTILRWLGPPQLPDIGQREHARRLWLVSWPFLLVVATILGIAVLVEPETATRRATTVTAVAVLVTVLHMISRSGRPVLASWVLAIGLAVLVTQRAWITGGIHAPVAVFYALFIVMAGALLGARAAFATACVCILGAVVLTVGTARGLLAAPPGAGAPLGAFVFVLLAIGLALVLIALVNGRSRREPVASEAVQMLVHDMRSPMQVLLAHLELLRDDLSGESRKDVEGAIDGARTLHRMTASLLDAGRLEAGSMPLNRTSTDVAALAQSVVQAVQVIQPSREITVETSGDASCTCDAELMRRVIENVVGNAMKHTPLAGHVRVAVAGRRDQVHITVQDEGPGIPVVRRRQIFQLYGASDSRSTSRNDSFGVGLAFCRLAVEAHGGSIHVEDGTEGGSVFVVRIPR